MSETTVVNVRKEPVGSFLYIGRPSKFGNPFVIGKDGSRKEVIQKFRSWIVAPEQRELREAAIKELRGERLGCYCKPEACHGDVYVELIEAKP